MKNFSTADIDSAFEKLKLSHGQLNHELDDCLGSVLSSIKTLSSTQKQYRSANDAISKRQGDLIEKERWVSIGQLAAGVAHEINNPLGFVQNNIFALQLYFENMKSVFQEYQNLRESLTEQDDTNTILSEELKQLKKLEDDLKLDESVKDIEFTFNQCIDGLNRITEITKSIKNFSHDTMNEDWEEFNLNVGIENMVIMSQNEYKYAADIITDYGDIPITFCCPNKMSQVFLNLIVNASHAIKARYKDSHQRGTITIKTYEKEGLIYCEFSDDGTGIPEDIRGQVFTPFFTTKPPDLGTGLGLSICFDIIKKHNGAISIDSELGSGTTFLLKIPVFTN